jgi:uncharacterized membrane protein YdjX (TVP38/TMEM64 family)
VIIGATIGGASGIFLAVKTTFWEMLRKKAGSFAKEMEEGFRKNAWSYLLFFRFGRSMSPLLSSMFGL